MLGNFQPRLEVLMSITVKLIKRKTYCCAQQGVCPWLAVQKSYVYIDHAVGPLIDRPVVGIPLTRANRIIELASTRLGMANR